VTGDLTRISNEDGPRVADQWILTAYVTFFALLAIFAVNRFPPTPHCQVVSHDMCELWWCDQGENECCLTAKCAKIAKLTAVITAKGEIEQFAELMLNTILNAHGPSLYVHASEQQVRVGKPAHPVLFILHPFLVSHRQVRKEREGKPKPW
jgi:hypothetical protein